MVKTLGTGRLPRMGSTSGLKVEVGSVTIGGKPGSFAVGIKTPRHATIMVKTTAGSTSWVRPLLGSVIPGYVSVIHQLMGTSGWPVGTSTAVSITYEVIGE